MSDMEDEVAKKRQGKIDHIDELIEKSSLGTPGAKKLRKRADEKAVEEIMRRLRESEGKGTSNVASIQDLANQLRSLSFEVPIGMINQAQQNLESAMGAVNGAKQEMENLMGQIQQIMGDGASGLGDALGGVQQGIAAIDTFMGIIQAAVQESQTTMSTVQNGASVLEAVAARH